MKGFIKKFYQRFICKHDYHLIGETFECFTEAIEENPKIDLIKYINQEIGEIGDTQHRIILRYDNELIPVVKNIIADFNLTNNIKS